MTSSRRKSPKEEPFFLCWAGGPRAVPSPYKTEEKQGRWVISDDEDILWYPPPVGHWSFSSKPVGMSYALAVEARTKEEKVWREPPPPGIEEAA